MVKIRRVGFQTIKTLRYIYYTKIQDKITDIRDKVLNLIELRKWFKTDIVHPPHLLKQKIVKLYAKKFKIKIFVETGTYLGEMIDATKKRFKKIYSIELDDKLYRNAKKQFSMYNHISIIQGDSSEELPIILSKIKQPCLFWLDAHYSAGNTAKGELETPIKQELNNIFTISKFNHIILIDDARMFKGKNDYPTLEELRNFISNKRPYYSFIVKNDIIRIHKKY